jgi:hypothetical protein
VFSTRIIYQAAPDKGLEIPFIAGSGAMVRLRARFGVRRVTLCVRQIDVALPGRLQLSRQRPNNGRGWRPAGTGALRMHSYVFRFYHLDGYLTHRVTRQSTDITDALQWALETIEPDQAVLEILEGETLVWRGTPARARALLETKHAA